MLEACAAIQRAGVAIELDPARGRLAQLAERDDRLAVVVDPASQPRPFAQQRLVRDLHRRLSRLGMPVEGEQARLHPRLDDVVGRGTGLQRRDLGAARPAAGRLAVRRHDDEPFEHASNRRARGVVERAIELLGARGDRDVDAAERVVVPPVVSARVDARSASSNSVNWSDGSAAGWSTTAATSSTATAGSTVIPARAAGPITAASRSDADIAGTVTVASRSAAPKRWNCNGRS